MNNVTYIFYLELQMLLRRSQEWLYPLGFFLMVMSLFPLALDPDPVFLHAIFSGCIWIAALLASLLAMQMIFSAELEDGNIEQLLLTDIPFALLIAIKLIAQWLIVALPLVLLTPVIAWFYHVTSREVAVVMLSLLLGTPIIICVGAISAALTLGLRQQGVLLSLLVLPLILPIVILGVSLIENANLGLNFNGMVAFLGAISLFTMLLSPQLIAAIIRISFDD